MVALDTPVLIWGIRREPDAARADMVPRCVRLIEWLKSRHRPIMLPSVVLAEYLTGFDSASQERQRQILGPNFFIAPFDAKAAGIAADLFDRELVGKAKKEARQGKQCIKADIKILATAIAHGATAIYADDQQMVTLARGKIAVKQIPSIVEIDALQNPPLPPGKSGGQSAPFLPGIEGPDDE